MRRLALLAVLLLGLASFVAWWSGRTRDDAIVPARIETEARAPGASPTERAAELERAPLVPPASTSRSIVRGRVVDESGKPLAKARVWLFALDGKWRESVTPPTIRVRGGDVRAFATESGADGRFAIDAPAPTGHRLRVEVETADHRGHVVRDLAKKPPSTEPALVAGENDLGDVVVTLRGAVTGIVRARGAGAVAGAGVLLENPAHDGFSASCTSEPDGSFALACVPDGAYSITTEHPEYCEARQELRLAHAEVLAGLELILVPIPTLSGVVVDDQGRPVVTQIRAFPPEQEEAGHVWCGTTTSAQDGTFELALDRESDHGLAAGGGSCSEWDSTATATPYFPAGARDVRIQLTRLAEVTLAVCDARTHAPIELAYVQLVPVDPNERRERDPSGVRDAWEHVASSGSLRTRGEGSVLVPIPPGFVRAWAAHYATKTQRLTNEPRQVIELEPTGAVHGTLVRDGATFATARVLLRPLGKLEQDSHDYTHDPRGVTASQAYKRERFEAEERLVHAELEGEFRFEDVDAGRYELLALADGAQWPRVLIPELLVRAGETVETGGLEFAATRSAVRLRLVHDDDPSWRELKHLLRAEIAGTDVPLFRSPPIEPDVYRIDGLPPARLTVRLGEASTTGAELRRFAVELVEGEARELTIDLRGVTLCELCVQVQAGTGVDEVWIDVAPERKDAMAFHASLCWRSDEPESPCTLVPGGGTVVLRARAFMRNANGRGRVLESRVVALPARGRFETTIVVP